MAISIANIEIMLMPKAVRRAWAKAICRSKTKVSSKTLSKIPLNMAKDITAQVGKVASSPPSQAIVPKSPKEHPNKHQAVFLAD